MSNISIIKNYFLNTYLKSREKTKSLVTENSIQNTRRREKPKLCLKEMTKHQRFILSNVRIHWIYPTANWLIMNLIVILNRTRNLEVLLTIFTSTISVKGPLDSITSYRPKNGKLRPLERRSKRSTLEIGARTSRLSAVAREVNQVFLCRKNYDFQQFWNDSVFDLQSTIR